MFIKNKKNSLFYILAVTLGFVISLAIIIEISYSLFFLKSQLTNSVKNNIEVSSSQLKKSIIPFIESYQITEYEEIIKNEMSHQNLLAIVVEDFLTGEIIGEKVYVTGVLRDKSTNLTELSIISSKIKDSYIKTEKEFIKNSPLINSKGNRIGTLRIYGTDYFINEKLKEVFFDKVTFSLIMFVVIFTILYLLIKNLLINPIKNIVNSLKYDKNSKDMEIKLNEYSSKEFAYLSDSINLMVDTIKTSNKELEESEFRWKFAVEGSGDGLWDWDLNKNSVFFSKKWKNMLGFEEHEIEGKLEEWEKRVHPDDMGEVKQDIHNHLIGKTPIYINEHRVLCKDGTYKWILDRGIVVKKDKDNKPTRLIGTHSDITKRKKHEKEMKQALTVFQSTHDSIMITNFENKIININNAFTKTTGYTLQEVKGKNPNILKSHHQDKKFYKKMWQNILDEGVWTGEIKNKIKDGTLIDEHLTISTIKNKKDEIEYFIAIFSDISMIKQQEKMLLQQARASAIGEMIGNIAHQWRQPLSFISTSATGLQMQLEMNYNIPKDDILNNLKNINEQTQYLSKTIDDFRNFFRSDISKVSEFNLKETIQKVNNLTSDSFKDNYVIKNINNHEDIYLKGVENLLIQALLNIYNNSLDALKTLDPKVKRLFFISVEKDEESKVIIEIKDNAKGVKKEYLEKIFEPYFTTKHQSQGTGLGLYMSHEIINKQFNGSILAFNEEFEIEGEKYVGAKFVIKL